MGVRRVAHLLSSDPVLVRLVRMTFHPDEVDAFLRLFDEAAPRIRAVPGCRRLVLLQDRTYRNVLTTLSHWDDDDALQRYRKSELFRATWSRTKPLFAAAPGALSHEVLRPDSGATSA